MDTDRRERSVSPMTGSRSCNQQDVVPTHSSPHNASLRVDNPVQRNTEMYACVGNETNTNTNTNTNSGDDVIRSKEDNRKNPPDDTTVGELLVTAENNRDINFSPGMNVTPFTNLHPFSLNNLSESAICTTDDEDNYSFVLSPSMSAGNGRQVPHVAGSLARNYNQSAATDNSGLDHFLDDTGSGSFQSRPLSDTPVLSPTEIQELESLNGECVDMDDDVFDGIGNLSYSQIQDLRLDDDYIHDSNEPNRTSLRRASSCSNRSGNTDSINSKKKFKLPLTMERIESQEIADIPPTPHNKFIDDVKNDDQKNAPNEIHTFSSTSDFDMPIESSSHVSPDGISTFPICDKLVVVMVGLPARGKSYLSNKLVRYLNWLQINSKIFNVGSTRRAKSKGLGPENKPLPDAGPCTNDPQFCGTTQDASFFSPDNKESTGLRELWAKETLDSLLDYLLKGDGCVGVFDATNTTISRRKMVLNTIKERSGGKLKVLFLESICNDKTLTEKNVLLKLRGPDYKHMDPKLAKQDFLNRLKNYEKVYETICDEEERNKKFQYIKMIDVGRKVISCNINGYIPSQIVYYFLNFNLNDRLIFVSRHGESYDNLKGKIGGDSELTDRGRKYAAALEKFVDEKRTEFNARIKRECRQTSNSGDVENINEDENQSDSDGNTQMTVLTSILKRAIETSEFFSDFHKYDVKRLKLLNELGSGNFDGMTYQEISNLYPKEFEERIKNKLTYRYPGIGGESYLDVIGRLKPIINEVERSKMDILIISHRVVCRILMAYFLNLQKDSISELDIPLHSVYTFEPKPFGVLWHLYEFNETTNSFQEVNLDNMSHNENFKTVKQVGISFRERKYSVVPTAPNNGLSRHSSFRSSFKSSDANNNNLSSIRKTLDEISKNGQIGNNHVNRTSSISSAGSNSGGKYPTRAREARDIRSIGFKKR